MKTYITVAGASTFEVYVLLEFKLMENGLFSRHAMGPINGHNVLPFPDRRSPAPGKARYTEPERRSVSANTTVTS